MHERSCIHVSCATLSSTLPVFILHNSLLSKSLVLPPPCLTYSSFHLLWKSYIYICALHITCTVYSVLVLHLALHSLFHVNIQCKETCPFSIDQRNSFSNTQNTMSLGTSASQNTPSNSHHHSIVLFHF